MRRYIFAWLASNCILPIYLSYYSSTPTAYADNPTASSDDFLVIEDFSDTSLDSLPKGWNWRRKDDDKPKLYTVQASNGKHYLAAQDTGHSVVLIKQVHWDPQKYPIMTWCWRADELPPGGDERYTETNDSAAGVYVIFSHNFLGIPRQIKYVWSTTLAQGTIDRRKGIARPWFVVLESGPEKLGQWIFAAVDLESDHKRVIDDELPEKTIGIAVLTDANSTRAHARAAYADFRVWPRKAQGSIPNYCATLAGTDTITHPTPHSPH